MLRELSRREIPAVAVNRRTADVTNVADARRALAGADVVYHAANAAYATWPRTLPPIMDGLVGALSGTSTRLVYGDNLYAYGRVTGPITESTPERASSPNELVRKRLAEQVLQAHGVIGRSSDFIGAGVTQSIFGERAIGPALAGKPAEVLGDRDQPHSFMDVDDAARGLVTFGLHPEADGRMWLLPCAPATTARELVALVAKEVGHPVPLSVPPLPVLRVIALFNPTLRAALGVVHQSKGPWVVDASAFEAGFGAHTTPTVETIHAMVEWYRSRLS